MTDGLLTERVDKHSGTPNLLSSSQGQTVIIALDEEAVLPCPPVDVQLPVHEVEEERLARSVVMLADFNGARGESPKNLKTMRLNDVHGIVVSDTLITRNVTITELESFDGPA